MNLLDILNTGFAPLKPRKTVPSQKSQRTIEQVERLRVSAQLKRDVRAKRLKWDHKVCTLGNPCYKVGKPSQR